MIDYVSPVFWLFFVLCAASLLVLRRREPDVPRPFRVPLYPLTPLLFCGAGLYLLYSSLAYAGAGALHALGRRVRSLASRPAAAEPRTNRASG